MGKIEVSGFFFWVNLMVFFGSYFNDICIGWVDIISIHDILFSFVGFSYSMLILKVKIEIKLFM